MIINDINLLNVCNIALHAGLIINKYYKPNPNVTIKKDKSPLTEADLASNNHIINSLIQIDSAIPILTEESFIEWNTRKHWSKYWLIDPLDGTKEFIKHNGEFTVNIALIENNQPILGVIYAPQYASLYYAIKNKGAFKIDSKKNIISLNSSKKLKANKKNKTDHILIFGSRSHSGNKFDSWISKNFTSYELIKKGSSIKFCEIAEGIVDIYPRFGPTSEWDTAAGHIILEESGGSLKTTDHKKILYNKKESVINPPFVASCNLSD